MPIVSAAKNVYARILLQVLYKVFKEKFLMESQAPNIC